MRIPDLLVDLKKMEERLILLTFDMNQMWRLLSAHMPEIVEVYRGVSRETEEVSTKDSPQRTRKVSIVEGE